MRKGAMAWFERVRVVILVVGVVGVVGADAATVREGQERPADHIPVTQAVSAALGRIVGAVTDPAGVPLDGAVVSAFGPSGPELALANAGGRFMLRSLAPGAYFVQAHLPGFAASRRELVEVSANTPTVHAITLSRVGPAAETVAASVGESFHAASAERGDGVEGGYSSEQPAATAQTVVDGAAGAGTSAPHDHGAKTWYLRRAQRSVLKDAETLVAAVPLSPRERSAGRTAMLARTAASAARFATGLFDLPLSGEVNLLTRGMLDAAPDMIAVVPGSAGIANLSVGAPVWHGDWLAQGAMSTGDLSGLVVSGAYLADSEASHQLAFIVSYGQQRYQGANPAALTIAAESRYAASFGASDRWTVSRRLTIDYGGRYATYGYTEQDGLFSPRAGVTVTPLTGLRIRVGASQEMVAPGAEEFLPPTGHVALAAPRADVRGLHAAGRFAAGAHAPFRCGAGGRPHRALCPRGAPVLPGCHRPNGHAVWYQSAGRRTDRALLPGWGRCGDQPRVGRDAQPTAWQTVQRVG